MQKVGKKWLCEHNPTQALQLRGVLKSPGGISSGKLFCTSQPVFRFQVSSFSALPLSQPQAPCSHLRQKNSPWNQTGETPLSSEVWTNCSGHPAWASNPLNNPALKYRGLFFWPWVWLFHLKHSLDTQNIHHCHRAVLLKKRTCKKQYLFWEKLWERILTEDKLIQGLTVLI